MSHWLRARAGTKRVTEPSHKGSALRHCASLFHKPKPNPNLGRDPRHINCSESLISPFMTVTIPSMNRHVHPSNTSPSDHYRSLDRALAAKYVQLVLAHRRRVVAAQSGGAMRPRCVLTFLSPSHPYFSWQRGNMRSTSIPLRHRYI
jgi:hypothetical protein